MTSTGDAKKSSLLSAADGGQGASFFKEKPLSARAFRALDILNSPT